MSYIKITPNLFLEVAELRRLISFVDDEGFRKNIIQNSASFGLIKDPRNLTFLNGKVEVNSSRSTGGDKNIIRIRPIQAINSSGQYISTTETKLLEVPSDGKWYYVTASHIYSNLEKGTISIAENGDITGVGTEFTKVLRGGVNFPSRIRFYGSTKISQQVPEYDVLEVIDDTHAKISHPFIHNGAAVFEAQSNLKYAVVGTFTAGVGVPNEDKFPFQYDSAKIQLVNGTESAFEEDSTINELFVLARIRVDDGNIVVQDRRTQIWETKGSKIPLQIPSQANPLIGIEQVKWENILSPSHKNRVYMAWGMRSQNWSINSSQNILTIYGSAIGGVFKSVDDFTNGDFNGWRVYTENGKYSKIVSSIKQGQAINLTLDVLDVRNYSDNLGQTFNNSGGNAQWVLVVPDCEEIELIFTPHKSSLVVQQQSFQGSEGEAFKANTNMDLVQATGNNDNNNTERRFTFPINSLYGICDLDVFRAPFCLYNVKYRYKTDRTYSQLRTLPEDTVGYYIESSFNENGGLKPIQDRVRHPYEPSETEGYLKLTISPKAYSIFMDLIYKGDLIGVNTVTNFTTAQVFELTVGSSKRYQFFTGNISLSDDVYISLNNTKAVEGNEFLLHFDAKNITLNGRKIFIIRDYGSGSPVIMKEITQADIYAGQNQTGGITFRCVFSDTKKWNIVSQNYSIGEPNKIIMIDGVISDLFNAGGMGKVEGLFGYALCNGENGTSDMRDLFVVGAGREYNVGDKGGVKQVQLNLSQLPKHRAEGTTSSTGGHSHKLTGDSPSTTDTPADNTITFQDARWGGEARYQLTGTNKPATRGNSSSVPDHSHTFQSNEIGGDQPHENRPPYYAVIYAKKLY